MPARPCQTAHCLCSPRPALPHLACHSEAVRTSAGPRPDTPRLPNLSSSRPASPAHAMCRRAVPALPCQCATLRRAPHRAFPASPIQTAPVPAEPHVASPATPLQAAPNRTLPRSALPYLPRLTLQCRAFADLNWPSRASPALPRLAVSVLPSRTTPRLRCRTCPNQCRTQP
jgi:hypothetical protein